MQNYEFSLEFNPDIIQHIYSLIKDDPAYTPRFFRNGMLQMEQALQSINDTRAMRIGAGIIDQVGELFVKQFPHCKAIVVADTNTFPIAGKQVEESLMKAGVVVEEHVIYEGKNLHANFDTMGILLDRLHQLPVEVIPIAVGAGTLNDLTKLAAHLSGRHYMVVPTAASNGGYTAYGAAIRMNGIKQSFPCPGPQAVLADTDIIIHAPAELNQSGYADLLAKMTSGADWILADWMGIDHINEKAWKMSQNGFHETMLSVERIMAGEPIDERKNIEKMMEGLLLSGLAMQVVKSDLPSSGAEHQLTGIWEMERAVSGKDKIAHGKLLSIALLAITAVYNKLLAFPFDEVLDVKKCVKEWPTLETYERKAHDALSKVGLQKLGMQVAMSNYVTPEKLSFELQQLKEYWPEVRDRLAQQIMPVRQLYDILKLGRMPTRPIEAGISWEHVRQTLECVPYLSKRFNVMSLVAHTGYLTPWLDDLFIKTKKFETL